jgi:hypothetical protein
MKTTLAYFFTFLMVLLVFSFLLISCKTAQLPPDINIGTHIEKDTTSYVQITDHSKAIIDSLNVQIGLIKTAKPECDSITNVAISNILRTLNTTKQSGDNGYKIKYNELLKRLELIIKVGSTKTENTTSLNAKIRFQDRFITKTITLKERLPQWQLYLMLIGSGTIVFLAIKLLFLIKGKLPFFNH